MIYKGLKAKLERYLVTEEELDKQLLRLRTKRCIPVTERASRLGDELVLDYAGFVGAEQFEGGTAQGQTLTLGSGQFIPGFEEQLVGHRCDDSVDVHVTFPKQYHAAQLAGKQATFRCKIREIRVYQDYANDEEFAREVGHCESYAAMREQVRKRLQDYYDERAEAELQVKLADLVCDSFDYTLSAQEDQTALEQELQALNEQLLSKGLTLAQYCGFRGITEQQLREELLPQARRSYKTQLALEKIAELEQLRADAEDIAALCEEICTASGMTMEQLMPQYDAAYADAVSKAALLRKTLAFLRENAVIEEDIPEK